MRLNFGALFGWGIGIYAVMFLLWSGFITYGFTEGFLPRVVGFVVLIIVGVIAGRSLRLSTWRDILPYSLSWAILMAVIDGIMNVPFAGFALYVDPNIWFGYAVVALSPLLCLYPGLSRFSSLPRV